MDVVDPAIFLASAIDIGRLENALEKDPFDFGQTKPSPPPSPSPNEAVEESQPDVSGPSPTLAPTARYEFVVGNGGCPVGKQLFEIRMFDEWGDGWDGTRLQLVEETIPTTSQSGSDQVVSVNQTMNTVSVTETIQVQEEPSLVEIFHGGLALGMEEFNYACLQHTKCYHVSVGGGLWEEEVKWEIRNVTLGEDREERMNGLATAKGLAPTKCQFSIPDNSGALACLSTCGLKPQSTVAPTSSPRTVPPTATIEASVEAPTVIPIEEAIEEDITSTPSDMPTDKPVASPTPSPSESLIEESTDTPTSPPTNVPFAVSVAAPTSMPSDIPTSTPFESQGLDSEMPTMINTMEP